MSRLKIYENKRYVVYSGNDIALGKFIQLYDKHYQNDYPDTDGLVFDWSEKFQIKINEIPQDRFINKLEINGFEEAGDYIFNHITLYTISLN